MKNIFLVLISSVILTLSGYQTVMAAKSSKSLVLGFSYPPIHNKRAREATAKVAKDLQVHHIRFDEEWAHREKTKGKYNLKGLTSKFDWAAENNLNVFLTIKSDGPDWACKEGTKTNRAGCAFEEDKLPHFRSWVRTEFQALSKGNYPIKYIQFGNEWMAKSFHPGTGEEFVAASNIVYEAGKEYFPNVPFVLGGFTTWIQTHLAGLAGNLSSYYMNTFEKGVSKMNYYCNPDLTKCKGKFTNIGGDKKLRLKKSKSLVKIDYVLKNAKYDMIDLHWYDVAENWPSMYKTMKDRVRKPIVISEFGGPWLSCERSVRECFDLHSPPESQSKYTDAYQAQRLRKYLEILSSLDIEAAYLFGLEEKPQNRTPDHRKSSLIKIEKNKASQRKEMVKKPSYNVFKEFSVKAASASVN